MNFLEIQLKIVSSTLVFDIYYKATNSFNYLIHSRSHRSHTKNSFALFRRILNIVTDNTEKGLRELKKNPIERNYPPEIIYYTFTKCFLPKLDKSKDLGKIDFHKDI